MISRFLREQKRYTLMELCNILGCSEENAIPLMRKLKEYGVLKIVPAMREQKNMTDLEDKDIIIAGVETGETDFYYVITYVGIITVAGRVLICYPKYIQSTEKPVDEFKQVLKVIEKYNSKEQIIRMFNESNESRSFNLLAVLMFLITDYYENGLYTSSQDITETNGTGEILWDKTINETFTYISNNKPYYMELKTRKRVFDDYDYFRRLHGCILTMASKELEEAALLKLFDITEIDISSEELDDFGDKRYILSKIEKELNVQFNTRKQLVLKTIYAYVALNGTLSDIDCLSMFGTNCFNLIWEDVCKVIMGDQLEKTLGELELPKKLDPRYQTNKTLRNLIEKPKWTVTGQEATDTLIPDSVSITDSNFVITDAKYYMPILEPGTIPAAIPGIESVTKQYLYQLAYKDFIADHGFNSIINCFIMPTEGAMVVDKGEVQMNMFNKSSLCLQPIKVRLLPSRMAYEHYLSGRTMKLEELLLIETS